jgi:hypothetical protein
MDEQTTTPDLTRLFAPEDLWPDPSDCPEWPVYPDAFNASMNGPRTRQDAESRLYSLSRQLHGNETPRDPTPAEKQTAHERFFAEPTPGNWKNWQFQALGLTFRPANHSVEAQARAAVEAAHVRGWLRKLDAAAELESKRKRDAEQARLQSKVKSWPEREAATAAELERLQEGEKRHLASPTKRHTTGPATSARTWRAAAAKPSKPRRAWVSTCRRPKSKRRW